MIMIDADYNYKYLNLITLIPNTLRNVVLTSESFLLLSWFEWICWTTPGPVPIQIGMSGHSPQQAYQALPQQEGHGNHMGKTNFTLPATIRG